MGLAEDGFTDLVLDIVARHAADLDRDRVTSRPSRHGKYVSVTLSVEATSQAQLDAIYRDLTSCTKVLMAL
jgi:putative lipoic acid-binding regulatory protein